MKGMRPQHQKRFEMCGRRLAYLSRRTESTILTDQPNAHYGLGALSAWERPSQGIFLFHLSRPIERRTLIGATAAMKPEGCPNGLGGVSA
jgi:hypothetical protein